MSLLSQSGPTTSYGRGSPARGAHGIDAMEGVVERGPHQLGHARVEDGETRAARVCLHVDHAREEHARGPHERAAGLEHER